jgi:hypothetical protein
MNFDQAQVCRCNAIKHQIKWRWTLFDCSSLRIQDHLSSAPIDVNVQLGPKNKKKKADVRGPDANNYKQACLRSTSPPAANAKVAMLSLLAHRYDLMARLCLRSGQLDGWIQLLWAQKPSKQHAL